MYVQYNFCYVFGPYMSKHNPGTGKKWSLWLLSSSNLKVHPSCPRPASFLNPAPHPTLGIGNIFSLLPSFPPPYHPSSLLHFSFSHFLSFFILQSPKFSMSFFSSNHSREISYSRSTLGLPNIFSCLASPFSWKLVEPVRDNLWLSFC